MVGGRLLSLALFLFVILLFGCTGGPAACPQCGANETTPGHSPAEVSQAMSRYLTEYYGLWSNQPETPAYKDGVWNSRVTIFTDSGGIMTLDVYFYDGNLSVQKMTQRIVLLEEKKGIVQMPGKVSCSEGKVKVVEFGNPYCVDCINLRSGLASFRKSFEDGIDYEYAVLHDYSDEIFAKYGDDNATLASKYYLCAQNFSKL
ncbi:MAG: hypothetical protein NT157_07040, partial [Candidatus Micrarchaeota archaeon]|nr:hypothetical protein [Candidatus Micrarchaeota archaeon]